MVIKKNYLILFAGFATLIATYFIYNNYKFSRRNEKLSIKDFPRLGVRFLDHVEYAIPENEVSVPINPQPNMQYTLRDYYPLLEKHYQAPVYLQFIDNEMGYGVFADENISKGQMIGEYTGIVRNVNFSKEKNDCTYAWGFPRPTKQVIDAKEAGNFTRFINHSEYPNVDMIYIPYNNRWHLVYVAKEPIEKGKQLFAHYGKPYWSKKKNKLIELNKPSKCN